MTKKPDQPGEDQLPTAAADALSGAVAVSSPPSPPVAQKQKQITNQPEPQASPQKPARPKIKGLPRRMPIAPRPLHVRLAYVFVAILIGLTYGFGFSALTVNMYQISGPLGATTNEAAWLTAAYLAPNVSMTLFLFKIRMQFGIRKFAEIAILVYMAISLLGLAVNGLGMALIVEFFSGIAGAALTSLTMIYVMEPLPPQKKMTVGISIGATLVTLGRPLAGVISPYLLELWGVQGLYLLELGLALMSLAAIFVCPLQSPARKKMIEPIDFVSFPMLAIGMGGFCILWSVGVSYWWVEAEWLGWIAVISLVAATIFAVIELNRKVPFIDVRWLTSRDILQFIVALLLFRIICSEQTTGAVGFLRQMGILNEQMIAFYVVLFFMSVAAGVTCCFVLKIGSQIYVKMVALVLLCIGSWLNSHLTILTRPEQMYVSQGLIAFASGLFMPAAMSYGMIAAFRKGFDHIMSFICLFITTQKIGAMMGSGFFRSFITIREKAHSHAIVQSLVMSDPNVAHRIQIYGHSVASSISDPVLRQAQGVAMLAQAASRQAYVLAYNDGFLLMSYLSAITFCLLAVERFIQLRRIRKQTMAAATA
nr:MFS transporter [uncultured Cohaesibacter sp.]